MNWLAAVVLLCVGSTGAKCPGPTCPAGARPDAAVVRVVNITGQCRSYGSGTLVHKNDRQGTVLSCAHLFSEGAGTIWVCFPDGRQCEASLAGLDRAWDLSALTISAPEMPAVSVAAEHPRPGERVRSCGYGSDGRYRCNEGQALGYARTAGTTTHETLQMTGSARDGDSGGPVLNRRGELVAVIWGTDGRTVQGTYCGRIRKFLARLLPPPRAGGVLTPQHDSERDGATDGETEGETEGATTLPDQLAELERRAGQREQSMGERIGRIENAVGLIGALRDPALLETALPTLLAALGLTAPPALAAIVGLKLLGVILRRRKTRRSSSRRTKRRPQPLNDEYANQLNDLYALSGRSTPADATLGREFDRALREAEHQGDDALGRWAKRIRQQVAKRFYRIHGESPMPAEPT